MSLLQSVIQEHEVNPSLTFPPLPRLIPPGHICDSRRFATHVKGWAIEPEPCEFMGRSLLYLFYGGLFFRLSPQRPVRASQYPIGFIFQSETLRHVEQYYPFDTGAIAAGVYGEDSGVRDNWQDCRLDGRGEVAVPCRLIQYVFGTNARYMRGHVSQICSRLPDPFPWLVKFLSSNLTDFGADQRHYRIECQCAVNFSLDDVMWVGYPDVCAEWFARIFEKHGPARPERWAYDAYRAARPADMCAILDQRAREFIRSTFDATV